MNDSIDNDVEKWIYGGLGPFIGAVVGVAIIVRGRLSIPTRYSGWVEFHGFDAAAWGMAILAIATAIHMHYFWSNTDTLAPYADLGKIAAIAILALSVAYLCWRVVIA